MERAGRRTGAATGGGAVDDLRTLWLDWDEHGERFKTWRAVVKESREEGLRDSPVPGPDTTLHLMKHMERNGGDPRRWLAEFLRERRIDRGDRVYHEATNLAEVMALAGSFDQLNLPGLACFEKLSRRLQAVIDAYSGAAGSGPNWKMARFYDGAQTAADAVSPQLRQWGLRQAKDEAELSTQRVKDRPAEDGETPRDDGSGAGRGKGGGKQGAGRGRGPAPAPGT